MRIIKVTEQPLLELSNLHNFFSLSTLNIYLFTLYQTEHEVSLLYDVTFALIVAPLYVSAPHFHYCFVTVTKHVCIIKDSLDNGKINVQDVDHVLSWWSTGLSHKL